MSKISKSKLKEVLSNANMSEGLIDTILKKIKQSKKDAHTKALHKKLDALTNGKEYQAILKKYDIEPMDWSKNYDR